MTGQLGIVRDLGAELVWLVVASGFAFVVGMVLAVLYLQGRRVPAAALPAGPGLAVAAVPLLGAVATSGWTDLGPDELRVAVTTFGALPIIGIFALGPVAATTWTVLAYTAARGAPRRVPYAVLGAVGILVAAGLVVAGGFAGINWIYAILRGVLYAGLGVLVVIALLGAGEEGPDAGAGAALGFPLLVAVGEASERGLAHLMMLPQTRTLKPEEWGDGVAWMFGRLDVELPYSQAALGAACLVALVGVVLAVREGRGPLALVGLVWMALAWLVLWSADLGLERLGGLSVLCQG